MSIRAVFDCMVFVQAAARPNGPAMACFDRLATVGGQLCVSESILLEIGEVLSRAELQARLPSLTRERVGAFLDDVKRAAVNVEMVPHAFDLPRDPKDERYLDLAIAASADYLVTWNEKHLTYLTKADTPEGREFCRHYPKLKILSPTGFLAQQL